MAGRGEKTQGVDKPTSAELAKMTRPEMTPFVAASVGRLSNLYPHWLLLHVETPLGIPSSRLIVLWLLLSEQTLTMGEIAKAIDLTPRGVTRIVDGLESDGLAKRITSEIDRRIKMVELTPKGQKFLASSLPEALVKFSELFSVLDKTEAIEFVRLIEKLTDQMKVQIDGSSLAT